MAFYWCPLKKLHLVHPSVKDFFFLRCEAHVCVKDFQSLKTLPIILPRIKGFKQSRSSLTGEECFQSSKHFVGEMFNRLPVISVKNTANVLIQ